MNKSKESDVWSKHKSLWEGSGLSQRQYCQDASLCPRKFSYHVNKLNKKAAVKPDFKFIGGVPRSILEKEPIKKKGNHLKIELPNRVALFLELSADMTLSHVIEIVGALPC